MIVIVIGVTGAGKTTVGRLLAQTLGWRFADADSFHSPGNIEKMRCGIPLDDADRAPWLGTLRTAILQWSSQHRNVVLACSALKNSYREILAVGPEVKFVYLRGSFDTIYRRLLSRHDHFATETILRSQFAALEEPQDAVAIDVDQSAEQIATAIRVRLKLQKG